MRIFRGWFGEELLGNGVGVGVADGLLNVANGVGVGVVSARETAPLAARTTAAKEITTLGNSADPLGLTLSSIRQKSLYR